MPGRVGIDRCEHACEPSPAQEAHQRFQRLAFGICKKGKSPGTKVRHNRGPGGGSAESRLRCGGGIVTRHGFTPATVWFVLKIHHRCNRKKESAPSAFICDQILSSLNRAARWYRPRHGPSCPAATGLPRHRADFAPVAGVSPAGGGPHKAGHDSWGASHDSCKRHPSHATIPAGPSLAIASAVAGSSATAHVTAARPSLTAGRSDSCQASTPARPASPHAGSATAAA